MPLPQAIMIIIIKRKSWVMSFLKVKKRSLLLSTVLTFWFSLFSGSWSPCHIYSTWISMAYWMRVRSVPCDKACHTYKLTNIYFLLWLGLQWVYAGRLFGGWESEIKFIHARIQNLVYDKSATSIFMDFPKT